MNLKPFLFGLAVAMLTGCHQQSPQKGGSANVGPSLAQMGESSRSGEGMPQAALAQPDNPTAKSAQSVSYERETVVTVPTESVVVTETVRPDGSRVVVTENFPSGTQKREHVKQGVQQTVSGSWKDTAREIGAKMAAAKPIQYVGVGALLFAAGGLFYAPLRVILGGGKQLPMAIGLIGVGLIVAPMLIIGNEALILIGCGVALFVYWLTIRVTRKEAEVDLQKIPSP